MTDHTKRQYDLAMKDAQGYGNRMAVALVIVAFVVPNLIFMVVS